MYLCQILYNLFNCHVTYLNNSISHIIQVQANDYKEFCSSIDIFYYLLFSLLYRLNHPRKKYIRYKIQGTAL